MTAGASRSKGTRSLPGGAGYWREDHRKEPQLRNAAELFGEAAVLGALAAAGMPHEQPEQVLFALIPSAMGPTAFERTRLVSPPGPIEWNPGAPKKADLS